MTEEQFQLLRKWIEAKIDHARDPIRTSITYVYRLERKFHDAVIIVEDDDD